MTMVIMADVKILLNDDDHEYVVDEEATAPPGKSVHLELGCRERLLPFFELEAHLDQGFPKKWIFNGIFHEGGGGTVGLEAVKLICQSE